MNDLTTTEVAKQLGVSETTLANYRSQGIGPPYRKIGRRVTYPRALFQHWLDSRIVQPVADSAAAVVRMARHVQQ